MFKSHTDRALLRTHIHQIGRNSTVLSFVFRLTSGGEMFLRSGHYLEAINSFSFQPQGYFLNWVSMTFEVVLLMLFCFAQSQYSFCSGTGLFQTLKISVDNPTGSFCRGTVSAGPPLSRYCGSCVGPIKVRKSHAPTSCQKLRQNLQWRDTRVQRQYPSGHKNKQTNKNKPHESELQEKQLGKRVL